MGLLSNIAKQDASLLVSNMPVSGMVKNAVSSLCLRNLDMQLIYSGCDSRAPLDSQKEFPNGMITGPSGCEKPIAVPCAANTSQGTSIDAPDEFQKFIMYLVCGAGDRIISISLDWSRSPPTLRIFRLLQTLLGLLFHLTS